MHVFGQPKARLTEEAKDFIDLYLQLGERAENFLPDRIFDNLTNFVRLCYEEQDDPSRQEAELQRYVQDLKESIPGYVDVSLMIMPQEDSKAFEYSSRRKIFRNKLLGLMDSEQVDEETKIQFENILNTHDYSLGTPPVTKKTIDFLYTVLLGDKIEEIRKFRDIIGITGDIEEAQWKYLLDVLDQMVVQSTHYTTHSEKTHFLNRTTSTVNFKGLNGLIRTVVSGQADSAIGLLAGEVFNPETVKIVEYTDPDTLYDEIKDDAVHVFAIKIRNMRYNPFNSFRWFPLLTRMVFVDDSPESRASNTSLVFALHNGIINTLNNVHNKKMGALANSQLNLRLILEKVNLKNIVLFRKAIEKKIKAYEKELEFLGHEQMADLDDPENEIILYKFEDFSRQVLKDKYILSRFGAYLTFIEQMHDPAKAEKITEQLIEEFEERTRAYYYSENKKLQIATVVEGGGRNQIRTYAEYLLQRSLKPVKNELVEKCKIILDIIPDTYERTLHTHFHKNFGLNLFLEKYKAYLTKVENEADNRGRLMNFLIDLDIDQKYLALSDNNKKIVREFISGLANLDKSSISDDVQMIIRDLLFYNQRKPNPFIFYNQEASWEYRDLFPPDRYDLNPFDIEIEMNDDGRVDWERLLNKFDRIKNTFQLFDDTGSLWDRFCENSTLVINDPANPTGYTDFNNPALLRFLKFLNNSKITLFLDEAYNDAVKIEDPEEPKWRTISRYIMNNIGSFAKISVVSSLSTTKNLGATGDRLGSLIATPAKKEVILYARKQFGLDKGNTNSLYLLVNILEIAQLAKKIKDRSDENLPKDASRYKIKENLKGYILTEVNRNRSERKEQRGRVRRPILFEGSPLHLFLLNELVNLDKLDVLDLPDDFKYKGQPFFSYYKKHLVSALNGFRVNKVFRSECVKRMTLAMDVAANVLEKRNNEDISILESDGSYLFNLYLKDFFSFQDLEKFTRKLAEERGISVLPYQKGFIRFSLGDFLEGSEESYRIFSLELQNVIRIFLNYWDQLYQLKQKPENKWVRTEDLLDTIFQTPSDKVLIHQLFNDFDVIRELVKSPYKTIRISDIKSLYHPFSKDCGVTINYIGDSPNAVFEFYEQVASCKDLLSFVSSKAFTKVYENLLPQVYKKIPAIRDLDINEVVARYGKQVILKYVKSKIDFQPEDYILDHPDDMAVMKEILIELEHILFSDAKVKILALPAKEGDISGDLARLEGYNRILRKYIQELLFYFDLPFEQEIKEPDYEELLDKTIAVFEEVIRIPVTQIDLSRVAGLLARELSLPFADNPLISVSAAEREIHNMVYDLFENQDRSFNEKLLMLYLIRNEDIFINKLNKRIGTLGQAVQDRLDEEIRLYVEELITIIIPGEIKEWAEDVFVRRLRKITPKKLHATVHKMVLFLTDLMNQTKYTEFYSQYNHYLIRIVETAYRKQNSAVNEMIQHGIAIHKDFLPDNELSTWNKGSLDWINSLLTRCGVIAWEQPVQTHTRIVTDAKKREYPFHKVDRSGKESPHAGVVEHDSPNEFIKKMQTRPPSVFFIRRLADFVRNIDADDYRCKIVTTGLVKELYIFQKAYLKYLTDNFRLVQQDLITLDEARQFVPDIIMFLGAPEKVISYPAVGYFDIKGPRGNIKTILTPLTRLADYFGNVKKPRLTVLNEKVKEMGGIPVHGSLFAIEENDGSLFVVQVSGDSGVGKSEMLAAMMLKWMKKNLPGIRSIKLIAGDMFHVFPDKKGSLYGIGTEVGDFSRVTDFDPDFIRAYRALFESSADSNVEDLNSRSTISGLCDISMPFKIDIMLTAYNFGREEAGIKRYANPENFILYRDSHGERKEKATSSDNPNIQRTLMRYTADPEIVTLIDKHGSYLDEILGWEKDDFTGTVFLVSTYKMMDKIDVEEIVNIIFRGKSIVWNDSGVTIEQVQFDIIKNRFSLNTISKETGEKQDDIIITRKLFSEVFESLASTPAGNPFIAEQGEHEIKQHLIELLKGGKEGTAEARKIQLGILSTDLGKKGKEITGPQKAAEDLQTLIREVRIVNQDLIQAKQFVKTKIIEAYGWLFKHHKHSLEVWRYNFLIYQLDQMRKARLVRIDDPKAEIDLSGLKNFDPLPEDYPFSPLLVTPNMNIELNSFSETYEQLMILPNNHEFAKILFTDTDKLYIAEGYSEETIINNMMIQLLLMKGYLNVEDFNKGRITEKVNRETVAAAKYACTKKFLAVTGKQE